MRSTATFYGCLRVMKNCFTPFEIFETFKCIGGMLKTIVRANIVLAQCFLQSFYLLPVDLNSWCYYQIVITKLFSITQLNSIALGVNPVTFCFIHFTPLGITSASFRSVFLMSKTPLPTKVTWVVIVFICRINNSNIKLFVF